jgi:hypothetical protein
LSKIHRILVPPYIDNAEFSFASFGSYYAPLHCFSEIFFVWRFSFYSDFI